MSKPTIVPEWATDENYAAGSEVWSATPTKVDPSVDEQELGWTPSERPPAQFMNWWQNAVGQWCAYLDGASFEGNHTFEDDLLVEGDLTVEGAIKHPTISVMHPLSSSLAQVVSGGITADDDPGVAMNSASRIRHPLFGIDRTKTIKGITLILEPTPSVQVEIFLRALDASGSVNSTGLDGAATAATVTATGDVVLASLGPLYLEIECGADTVRPLYCRIDYASE